MPCLVAPHTRHTGGSYTITPNTQQYTTRYNKHQEEIAGLNIYNILDECHHGPRPPPSAAAQQPLSPAAASSAAPGASSGSDGDASSSSDGGGRPARSLLAQAGAGRKSAARRAALAARYTALLSGAGGAGGWPVSSGLPPKGSVVPNWAHLLGGLGHNPPCTGEGQGAFEF